MLNKIFSYLRKVKNIPYSTESTNRILLNDRATFDLKDSKVIIGKLLSKLNNQLSSINKLSEVEFQVFSQWGDDGIIQYLINHIDIPNKIFIEFGVENYKESNTRFLLLNDNWSGLVIDGDKKNIEFIKQDPISWAFDIHATNAFITVKNINQIISDFLAKGYKSEIGILSIDIDGNDYWVWKQIHIVNPIIVIVEYNAVFGNSNAWTIPYKDDFYRLANDSTYQFWGVSLNALCILAEEKGYYFIGCNSNGNNAYFLRKDKIGPFKPLSCEEGYVESKFREYVDANGERWKGPERLNLIKGKEVFDIILNETVKI